MDGRVKRLETAILEYQRTRRPAAFLLDTGATFETDVDPFEYLIKNGVETPKGRIVKYPHETEGVDALSLSLYELMDDGIRRGGFSDLMGDLESDVVGIV